MIVLEERSALFILIRFPLHELEPCIAADGTVVIGSGTYKFGTPLDDAPHFNVFRDFKCYQTTAIVKNKKKTFFSYNIIFLAFKPRQVEVDMT